MGLIFIAHQQGHKVTTFVAAVANNGLLALLGVGTSIFLAVGVFGVR